MRFPAVKGVRENFSTKSELDANIIADSQVGENDKFVREKNNNSGKLSQTEEEI